MKGRTSISQRRRARVAPSGEGRCDKSVKGRPAYGGRGRATGGPVPRLMDSLGTGRLRRSARPEVATISLAGPSHQAD